MKFFAAALFLFAVCLQMVTAMSCAGAMDNLYGRVSDSKKWCQDPTSNMCRVANNNCRVAKSECDRICRSEGRICPPTCPN
ncbi:hypothetical protein K457DRAFT_142009 [Linnemannia elongata AG-77]|uniref:ShKT domain-containing protein n=1 Tax=Linnemannia elongata AG-77 TaxID=1314771 RepID=A0A197JGQ4_9FUNG|nr:hypothetical protein K457DRAFT_142009 [Linnemannia elongata AG-77]